MENEITDKIRELEKRYRKTKICYGGDGTLVSEWRTAFKEKKSLLPIRNYGQCPDHIGFLTDLIDNAEKLNDSKYNLKLSLHRLIRCETIDYDSLALSEFQIVNSNITEALRFDVFVNNEKYLSNVISTAVLVSSPFGATGYWSSVTRTIFKDGLGLAFIAPTVGVNNLILKTTDKIKIRLIRDCEAKISADKEIISRAFKAGDTIGFETSCENMPIFGLEQFHCNECRAKRSGTILSNQYLK